MEANTWCWVEGRVFADIFLRGVGDAVFCVGIVGLATRQSQHGSATGSVGKLPLVGLGGQAAMLRRGDLCGYLI